MNRYPSETKKTFGKRVKPVYCAVKSQNELYYQMASIFRQLNNKELFMARNLFNRNGQVVPFDLFSGNSSVNHL